MYAGSIFYVDYAGNLELHCYSHYRIKEWAGFGASGAGIVSDSIPEREYAESVAKADGLWRAIEIAETALTPDLLDHKQ